MTAVPPRWSEDSQREPPEKTGRKACPIAPAKTPTVIKGVIDRCKPPRDRCGIVRGAQPPRIVVSCAIHKGIAIYIGTLIPRGVPDIHDLRGRVVDPNIFYVVNRTFGWNGVDLGWNGVGHNPRTCRAVGDKPDSLVNRIVSTVDLNNLGFGVDRVVHAGVFNRLELGVAVVRDRELGLIPFYSRGLGDLSLKHRLLGLCRSGNESQDMAFGWTGRNPFEVLGQILW
jgi:hypothetical protein